MIRKLDSVDQALMLVRSSLVSDGELIGVLDGCAYYAHNNGVTKTIICRPAGIRGEGVVPLGSSLWATEPALVGMAPPRRHRTRKGGWTNEE